MSMPWPAPTVYDHALRERAKTFRDPEIQTGMLVEDNTGPIRFNGGGKYVCVYKVGKWIVRCFTENSPPKLAERYQAIIAYIDHYARDLPFLVHHEWVSKGITIQGQTLPFVKVAFIENSMQLGIFLSEHYMESQITQRVADLWLDVVTGMEKRGIAHGDLDITNILVCGNYPDLSLKLIDYDGMYVPTMAQKDFTLVDFGHEHFQPTQHSIRQFGPDMDRFSALIIYLSLIALAQNPVLWENCEANDTDRLLLGAEDYQRLGFSRNYQLLYQQHKNSVLRKCLHELEESIMQGRMPRSLQEIVVSPETEQQLRPLQARPPVIPIGKIEGSEPTTDEHLQTTIGSSSSSSSAQVTSSSNITNSGAPTAQRSFPINPSSTSSQLAHSQGRGGRIAGGMFCTLVLIISLIVLFTTVDGVIRIITGILSFIMFFIIFLLLTTTRRRI